MKRQRVGYDFQYVVLNWVINRIPIWSLRRILYKRFGMKLGKDSRIGMGTIVLCPQNIRIGDRTVVNECCVLDGRGGLAIGHDTSISMFTKIISASHGVNSEQFEYYERKTLIGHHVWTGAAAVVLDGSRIGNYAVIGANAVIKGNVMEKQIMIGNPAKGVDRRNIDTDYRLEYTSYFR